MGLTEKAPRFSWKIESTIDTDAPEITEGNVIIKDFDKAVLTAQENEPVRITEKIVGKELIVTSKGEKFIDFGQIVTGVVEVHVKGEKGQIFRPHFTFHGVRYISWESISQLI